MPTPANPNLRQACLDLVGEDETLLFADGHDDAILGIAERDGMPLVVYDVRKLIHLLRTREGMSSEEAEEFFVYNIAGSYQGEQTPIFVRRIR
jgi:hypothetical protein